MPWPTRKTGHNQDLDEDLTEATDIETPPVPDLRPEPEPTPVPEPEHVQEENTAPAEPVTDPTPRLAADWSWITPTRVAVAAAAVPSVLSLVWVASTVAEITGGPSGWAAGVFADVLIVSTVAVGWFNSDVRRLASLGGWVASIAAGLLLGWHHWGTEEVFFALVPVGAKFLWHVALVARTAWERRRDQVARARADAERQARKEAQSRQQAEEDAQAAEDSADDASLTVAQRREIADLKREAAFAKAKADAEAERERARIEAENTVDMATDRAEAERLKARYELAAQVGGRLPIQVLAQFLPDLPGVEVTEVHRDRSQIGVGPAANSAAEAIPAGFGAALTEARNGIGGIGGIGVDLGGSTAGQGRSDGGDGTGGTGVRPHHAARRASGQATRQRILAAIEEHGPDISTNELAEMLNLGRTTVRDHRKALAKAGHPVHPDQR